jgi:hypothetical protein
MPLLLVFRNKLTMYFTNDKENREKKIEAIQIYIHKKERKTFSFSSNLLILSRFLIRRFFIHSTAWLASFLPSASKKDNR